MKKITQNAEQVYLYLKLYGTGIERIAELIQQDPDFFGGTIGDSVYDIAANFLESKLKQKNEQQH